MPASFPARAPAQAVDNRKFITNYIETLCAEPKTDAVMDRFISDPNLKQHIRLAEAAFPGYIVDPHQIIAEGDTVAVRATMRGTHRGAFAGIAPTGKQVAAGIMLFYRVADNRIAEFWMQLDMTNLIAQLTL